MSVTRRGYAVFGICLGALVLGVTFGARALNAVVVPGLVALVVGWVGVKRTPRPTVTRNRPASGFPGDVREVVLEIGFGDSTRTRSATVRDALEEGLQAEIGAIEMGVPGRITYDCVLGRRGEHAIGPAVITITDALGLFEREFRPATTTDVLVYPPVERLSGYAREAFLGGRTDAPFNDRGEFDSLREYVPGDPLRDVHWKSSAKRDDFVVTEFAADTEREGLAIVTEAAPGQADEMASAAASVACWLLENGIEIDVTTPDGRLSGADTATRERVLALFARTGTGRVADRRRERADVAIAAETGGVTVTIGDSTIPFDRLVDPAATGRPRATSERTEAERTTPRDRAPAGAGTTRATTDGRRGKGP